ncbi:zinc finger protein 574-like [Amphibalanus amphitrite]|uniref:zinc finger protein 574-like n=1 Tax=Amphibalanus amphitrite TaxID=1232801 RepID=UPI001C91BAF2|nr:zinc finger protein 574-like [Amphibalanus amphitrite]
MLDEASFLALQECALRSRWDELCDVFLTPEPSAARRIGFPRFLLSWLRPDGPWPAGGGVVPVACSARYLSAAQRVLRAAADDADRLVVETSERRAGRFSLRLTEAGMEAAVAACLRAPPPLPPCAVVFAAGRRALPLPPLALLSFSSLPPPQRLSDGALLLPAAPPEAVQRLVALLQRPAGGARLNATQAAPLVELCRRLGAGRLAALLLAVEVPLTPGAGSDSVLPPPVLSPLPPDRRPAPYSETVRCRRGCGLPAEALLLLRAGVGTSVTLLPAGGVPVSAHKLALCMYSPLVRRTFETLAAAALDPGEVDAGDGAATAADCADDASVRSRSLSGDSASVRLPASLASPDRLVLPTLSAEDLHGVLDYIYGGETPAAPSAEQFRRRLSAWIDFKLLPMEKTDADGLGATETPAPKPRRAGRRRTMTETQSPTESYAQTRLRKRRNTTPAESPRPPPQPPLPAEVVSEVSPAGPEVVEHPREPPVDAELIVYVNPGSFRSAVTADSPAVALAVDRPMEGRERSASGAPRLAPPTDSSVSDRVNQLDSSTEDLMTGLATIAPLDADLTITAVPTSRRPPLPVPPPPPLAREDPDDPDYKPGVKSPMALQRPRRRGRPRRSLAAELDATPSPVEKTVPTAVDKSAQSGTTSGLHDCEHCGKRLCNATALADHVRTHTGEKPFVCEACGKAFSSLPGLRHHERTHGDSEKDCVCDVCGKLFTRHGLWSHLKTHSKPFLCVVCGQSFSSKQHLKNHQVSQHEPTAAEHVCHECGRAFTQRVHLVSHMRLHNSDRRKFCEICQRTWPSAASLRDHQALKHGDTGTIKCDQCDKTFRKLSSLRYHRRVHTGERPFKCSFCDKTFNRPDNLQLHMRRHTGERPLHCSHCSKSFISKTALNKHMSIYHRKESEDTPSSDPQEKQQPTADAAAEQTGAPAPKAVSARGRRRVAVRPVSAAPAAVPSQPHPPPQEPPQHQQAVQVETLSVDLPVCLLEETATGEQTFTVDLQSSEPQFVSYLT